MKNFDLPTKTIFGCRFISMAMCMLVALGMSVSMFGQTNTRYNDGYLSVFRQSAPAGSSFTLTGTTTNASAPLPWPVLPELR